jgi:AI-2 transport protein TqsA
MNAAPSSDRLTRFCLIALTTIAISVALLYTRTIMIPFVLAIFFAFILRPIKDILEQKLYVPKSLSLGLILLGIGLGAGLFSLLVSTAVRQLAGNADLYEKRFIEISELTLKLLKSWGVSLNLENTPLVSLINELPVFSFLRTLTRTTVQMVSNTFLVVIFVVFLLAGPSFRLPSYGIWPQVDRSIRSYLITKLITSGLTGVLTAIILSLFGLDMAMMFGFFAFILNFIPTVGSIIATLLPVPIALLQFTDPIYMLLAVGLPGAVQFTIGNIIEPKFMGDSLDLHPVTILLTLMFWGLIWGPIGMILATPITVMLKIALEQTKTGADLAGIMAGRFE